MKNYIMVILSFLIVFAFLSCKTRLEKSLDKKDKLSSEIQSNYELYDFHLNKLTDATTGNDSSSAIFDLDRCARALWINYIGYSLNLEMIESLTSMYGTSLNPNSTYRKESNSTTRMIKYFSYYKDYWANKRDSIMDAWSEKYETE